MTQASDVSHDVSMCIYMKVHEEVQALGYIGSMQVHVVTMSEPPLFMWCQSIHCHACTWTQISAPP